MSVSQKLIRAGLGAARVGVRNNSCSVRPANVVDNSKLKAKQLAFQKDDGLPVFLKGGTTDRILYYTTMGLSMLGLAGFVHLIYEIEFAEKEE